MLCGESSGKCLVAEINGWNLKCLSKYRQFQSYLSAAIFGLIGKSNSVKESWN